MSAPELVIDRRTRVVWVAGWGAALEQPEWATTVGVKLQRATCISFDEAVAIARVGGREGGFPAFVQKFVLSPATPEDPPVRMVTGTWRLSGPDDPPLPVR